MTPATPATPASQASQASQAEALRLRAEDAEDLAVIAACLQDALASVGEMAYDAEAKRFAIILVRFMWEEAVRHYLAPDSAGVDQVKAGLHFDAVTAVRVRGVDQGEPKRLLRLLTITCAPAGKPDAVTLVFLGGAEIRLTVERLHCQLQDLDEPQKIVKRARQGNAG